MRFFAIAAILASLLALPSPAAEGPEADSQKLVKPVPAAGSPSGASSTAPLAAAAAASTGPKSAGTDVSSNPDKVVEIPTGRDDQRIEQVLNSLSAQAGWFPDVRISAKDGMVTIEGRTKNAQQLEWLAKTADRLPTVVAVINKAEIETAPLTDLTPAWKEFKRIVEQTKRALPLLFLALALLSFFYFIGRFIYRGILVLWGRHINNPFLLSTVAKISMVPVWVIFFYLSLQTAGLSGLATTIIGGTGALGIVLGFAFKDIAENYVSGLLLAIRSPFTKGDEISVEGFEGYVRSLNMRGTSIIDYDGNIVLIPNSTIIKSAIRNKTANPSTRGSFIVGIGYDDSVAKAQELIYGVLKNIPAVLSEPGPLVVAEGLGSSTVNLKVMFWYDCVKSSFYRTRSLAISQAKEALLAEGISLPDDAREIVFTDPLKVRMLESAAEASSDQADAAEKKSAKANSNKAADNAGTQDSSASHEADVKKLGDNVDLMHHKADHALLEK
ncbi:MAG: mechanosensitive ion channel [Proteobacteria bacterium]|nr:MAG: mechanosensitive ion channel [Pseudomonadota bacterium]